LVRVAEKVAEIFGRSFEEIARITGRNVIRLFKLPDEDRINRNAS